MNDFNTLKETFYALFSIFSVAVILFFCCVVIYAIYESGIRDSAKYACRDKTRFEAEVCRLEFVDAVLVFDKDKKTTR